MYHLQRTSPHAGPLQPTLALLEPETATQDEDVRGGSSGGGPGVALRVGIRGAQRRCNQGEQAQSEL